MTHPGPSPQDPEDSIELIRRHRTGDRGALEMLFQRYYDRVFRWLRAELYGNAIPGQELADAVQDVFVRVLEGLDKFEPQPDTSWLSWIATLARRTVLNRRRAMSARKRAGDLQSRSLHTESSVWQEAAAHVTGILSRLSADADKERLDACVARLSDDQRRVVLLRDYLDHEWATVGRELGKSPEACEQLHRRARAELARLFQIARA